MSRLLKTEQPHQKEAFERYHALGHERSYERLARELGVVTATVKLWGRSFDWQDRIQHRELESARRIADRTETEAIDQRGRHRKVIEMALVKIARAIAEDRVRFQASDLERIVRLLEKWDGTDRWADGPPWDDPQLIVEYLQMITSQLLQAAYTLLRNRLAREFPEYAELRLPLPADPSAWDSKCSTLALLDASLAERGIDPHDTGVTH